MKNIQPFGPSMRAKLETAARAAAKAAYAPYSCFRVGAAVLGRTGKIYAGCNVENASYSLCACAEKTAVLMAVAAGERAIDGVAIYTPTRTLTTPCGACRQVIKEFGPAALVIAICDSSRRLEMSLSALLPRSFGPEDLLPRPRRRKGRK